MFRKKKVQTPADSSLDPRDRMIELGHQLKLLSEQVIVTAQELKNEELHDDHP